MPKPKLTRKQRELVAEVKQLISTLNFDPDEIATEADHEGRTMHLELVKDQIIRSAVILRYVMMDEGLSVAICWHFFGKKRSFDQLWKTKRFKSFNYFILEKLHLLQKLDFVRNSHNIPKWVVSDLTGLNELRNGFAHSLFPQNRRRTPDWKGQSIFTQAGFRRFLSNMKKAWNFFDERFLGGSPEKVE